MRNERKAIDGIVLINPMIYCLQDKIDKEQESVIEDMVSPADRIIKKLIELDNRRIDLCNLKVLYGFIERGLGERFALLRSSVFAGESCSLYSEAMRQIEAAGYTADRVLNDFDYLFKQIKRKRKKRRVLLCKPIVYSGALYSSEALGFLNR